MSLPKIIKKFDVADIITNYWKFSKYFDIKFKANDRYTDWNIINVNNTVELNLMERKVRVVIINFQSCWHKYEKFVWSYIIRSRLKHL